MWRHWEEDTHIHTNHTHKPANETTGLEQGYLIGIILIQWQLLIPVKGLLCPGLGAQDLPAPFPSFLQLFEADVVSILQLKKPRLREVLAQHPTVKDYGGSESLPCLLANESAWHCVMHAGRKHKIPGSETRFYFPITADDMASCRHQPSS